MRWRCPADRRLAYITNYGVNSYTQQEEGGNSISILDLVRREKLGEIELGKFHRPHGIELGRSGRLYATCDFPPSLLVIDPAKRAILREYPVRPGAAAHGDDHARRKEGIHRQLRFGHGHSD